MGEIFDPSLASSGSLRDLRKVLELRRSGIMPLQTYFDPAVFTGPEDPKIGLPVVAEDRYQRFMVLTGWAVALLILACIILNGFVPS